MMELSPSEHSSIVKNIAIFFFVQKTLQYLRVGV